MKSLLALVGVGTLAFLLVAMVQEWSVFSSAWFPGEAGAPTVTATEADAALATLRHFLTLVRHAHGSGGDARFIERLPASERITGEIGEDVDYLRRNGRRQDMKLVELDVIGTRRIGEASVELHVREQWDVAYLTTDGRRLSDSPGRVVCDSLYLLTDRDGRWTVDDWKPSDAALELR